MTFLSYAQSPFEPVSNFIAIAFLKISLKRPRYKDDNAASLIRKPVTSQQESFLKIKPFWTENSFNWSRVDEFFQLA